MKNILIVLIISLVAYKSQAQTSTSVPVVIPLSPNAAEFEKYGNVPVSPVTGTPNIAIPLYEIVVNKIKVPISLSYHASGIKVNQKATWVGLGWSLNAGGIISRSVNGLPDESIYGWMQTQNTTSSITSSNNCVDLSSYASNNNDATPDFFSYNLPNLSGRFIYSQSTSKFQTIPTEPVVIGRTTGTGNIDNTYQIKDVDGAIYYFQDKQLYFNDGDGTVVSNKYVQSWYLSKIVSADLKDTVQFNYITSTTQGGTNAEQSSTETRTYQTGIANNYYTDLGSTITTSIAYHSYIALKEIIFRGGKVVFNSITPRRDYLGCMLDGITVFNNINNVYTPVYSYKLNYDYFTTQQPVTDEFDYRLRLLSINKLDYNTNNISETHQFIYNATALPSINSYSADYWGYYNGAGSQQGWLPSIPPPAPELSQYQANNSLIGAANRNESDAYIQAGILQKIIYPTKGYTLLNFESNQYVSDQVQTTPTTISSGSLTGAGRTVIKTNNVNFNLPPNVLNNSGVFTVTLSPYTNPAALDDVPQRVTLTDVTTNTMMGTWVHDGNMPTTNTMSSTFIFDPSHSYQVKLVVNDNAPTSVSFSLLVQITTTQSVVKKGGGLRIASMQNYGSDDKLSTTEKYTYLSPTIGKNDQALSNNSEKKTYMLWRGDPCFSLADPQTSISYYGSAGYSGQSFEGANVLYGEVRKTMLDASNNTNGQKIYLYDVLSRPFSSIYNPSFPGGREFIDNSLGKTSLPTSELTYTLTPTGTFTLLNQKDFTYGGNYLYNENIAQVTLNNFYKNGGNSYSGNICNLTCPGDITKYYYSIAYGPSKPATEKETDYSDPNNPLIVLKTYSYDNPTHLQVTKTTTTGSDGQNVLVQNKYPADYTDTTYGSNLLRAQSINNPVLEQTITKNNTLVKKVAANYINFQGSILPNYVMEALTNGVMETRLNYNKYDSWKNLQEVSKTGAATIAYQWGYNNIYPIAEIKNALSTEFYYRGYEESTGSGIVTGISHTGTRYTTTAGVSWTRPNSRTYVISYWYLSGGLWKYSPEQPYTANNFTMQTASGYDDVRIYPSDAQMTTYTYTPLVGMTSMTDAKGQTTTYEYDSFQRLMNVKDKDGNIIKHTDYHYQGQ